MPGSERLAQPDLLERFERRRPLEDGPAREHRIKDRAQRVNVGRRLCAAALAIGLFGGHVFGRSDQEARERVAGRAREQLGHAEVAHLQDSVRRHQDVRGLQIAVHDSLAMGVMNGTRQRENPPRRAVGGLRGASHLDAQARAADVFQREIRDRRAHGRGAPFTNFKNLDDIGMLKPRDGRRFEVEARPDLVARIRRRATS